MTKYIMMSTTTNTLEEASKLSSILLTKRLVSCCQTLDIKSAYHWKGKVEIEKEYLLQVKTKKELYKEVEETILENHSYEVPQIIAYDIIDGHKDYLEWIDKETK